MKYTKTTLLVLLSGLTLVGCSSSDPIAEEQSRQAQQIDQQSKQINDINTRLSEMKNMDVRLYRSQQKLTESVDHINKKVEGIGSTVEKQIEQESAFYTIKENDTLYRIASEHKMSLEALIELNPQIKNPKRLLIGDVIRIK